MFLLTVIALSSSPLVENENNGEDEDCNVENGLDDLVGAAYQHLVTLFAQLIFKFILFNIIKEEFIVPSSLDIDTVCT